MRKPLIIKEHYKLLPGKKKKHHNDTVWIENIPYLL